MRKTHSDKGELREGGSTKHKKDSLCANVFMLLSAFEGQPSACEGASTRLGEAGVVHRPTMIILDFVGSSTGSSISVAMSGSRNSEGIWTGTRKIASDRD